MKICICTTPIRPYPTDFPPFGSMAIIQAIRDNTTNLVSFYNIDYHRPDRDEVRQYFLENEFDVVGISAVVSTAYAYVKFLGNLIREISPKTKIIVGGNLAASAEMLLRKCAVDYCVAGDGEKIIVELLNLMKQPSFDISLLESVKGISYLEHGKFRFTGYAEKPSANEVAFPDYSILEEDGSIDYFVTERVQERLFAFDGVIEPGKRVATVVMTKGCVARCTFCHRWEKGFRSLPVEALISHVRELMEKYNVGFIQVADENFGSNKKVAYQIAEQLGALGLLWQVAGVRANTVTKEALQHWKNNGCISVYFGNESGSQKMLDIMEKKTTVEENVNALKWTGEVGINTIIQLIIGMPGEDDQTLEETFQFLKRVSPFIKQWENKTASDLISINYAQALPGTPLYEYGRENGLIGSSLEAEEQYLLAISDTDAYKEDHFINMTGLPLLQVLSWRQILQAKLDDHHFQQIPGSVKYLSLYMLMTYYFGILRNRISKRLFGEKKTNFAGGLKQDFVSDSGYFNIKAGLKFSPLLLNPLTRNRLAFFVGLYVFSRLFLKKPFFACRILTERLLWLVGFRRTKVATPTKSLRKIINITNLKSSDEDAMLLLRKGR